MSSPARLPNIQPCWLITHYVRPTQSSTELNPVQVKIPLPIQMADFQTWADEIGLNQDTVAVMQDNALACMKAIAVIAEKDIRGLKLKLGQKAILVAGVHRVQNASKDSVVPPDPIQPGQSGDSEDGPIVVPKDTEMDLETLRKDPKVQEMLKLLPPGILSTLGKSSDTDQPPPGNYMYKENLFLQPSIPVKYHDITENISLAYDCVDEEIVTAKDGVEMVLRTAGRSAKIPLSKVSVANWNLANYNIMYKLLREGVLGHKQIPDYLGYSVKIMDFLNLFDWKSILVYDREYRKKQAAFHFKWGSDPPHLSTSLLVPKFLAKPAEMGFQKSSYRDKVPDRKSAQPVTSRGQIICKSFNNKGGCKYGQNCKYAHVCLIAGCEKEHPQFSHNKA